MTFSHDDIRARLVDYLYGQLDDEARAAFQAHLGACAACHAEVSGAERARMVAREVVRRPLGDAVPERVRARAFEAARAAVATRAGVAPGQAKAVAAATPAGEGWFGRLRRRWTWTFPTFATVAAMAVFLLVRATIFREAKAPVSADRARELATPAEPAPVLPDTPAALAPPSDEAVGYMKAPHLRAGPRNVQAPQAEGAADSSVVATASKNGKLSHLHRAPPAGAAAPAGSSGLSALSSGSRGAGAAQPALVAPRKAAPQKAAASDADEFGGSIDEERARTQAPAAVKREFAAPPPPPAPAAAVAPKGGAPSMMDLQDDVAPEAEKRADKKSKTNTDKEPIAGHAEADEAPKERAADRKVADPALARASRAESLMNERRWDEAIPILRDLLRRYPSHPAVPRWRALLKAAQAGLDAPEEMFAAPPR